MSRLGNHFRSFVLAGLGLASMVSAGEPEVNRRGLGQRISNFSMKNTLDDKTMSLYGLFGKKAGVFFFAGVDCPLANRYIPRLKELNSAYRDKGVVFFVVNSNAGESPAKIRDHALEFGLEMPVLKDQNNVVADMMFVDHTNTVVVLDREAKIRYRGAIDDQYGLGSAKAAPEHEYLKDALEAILAGRPVAAPATAASGCVIDRAPYSPSSVAGKPRVTDQAPAISALREREDAQALKTVGNVTYAGDIAAIVAERCQSCHRPGQAAPFSLLGYDDVRRRAGTIREAVDDRRMPPWHADPRYGSFTNDRALTPLERAKLIAWIDSGAPLGDASRLPQPRAFASDWTIGKPDLVFEIPEPLDVPASGVVDYVYVKLPKPVEEDLWIQAAEAQPGDRAVVHHIIVFAAPGPHTEREPAPAVRRRGGGMGEHICGYAPGDLPTIYPEGTAKKIAKGSTLFFQLHYTPNGKPATDRSRVGFVLAKKPVEHRAYTHGIAQSRFRIPPNDPNFEVRSQETFDKDVLVYGFMPHMHLRGKDFQYVAVYPDGRSETLLSAPRFDFGWQSAYYCAKPLALPKGTRIECTAHFDNSAENPLNPDPSQTVKWGDQTFEEMMIGYIDYALAEPLAKKVEASAAEAGATGGSAK